MELTQENLNNLLAQSLLTIGTDKIKEVVIVNDFYDMLRTALGDYAKIVALNDLSNDKEGRVCFSFTDNETELKDKCDYCCMISTKESKGILNESLKVNDFTLYYNVINTKQSNKLRVITTFSGIGTQEMALRDAGIDYELIGFCEIDKYAIQSYKAIHGDLKNYGDITQVEKLDECDFLTYSSPCFVGDTLVLTSNGYKQIKDIKIGDMVITHTGEYKPVLNVFDNGIKDIVKVKGMGFDEIKCTPNHKFYVRELKYRYIHKGRKTKEGWKKKDKEKYFELPKWVEAKDMHKGYYFGIPLNNKAIIPSWNGIDYKWSDGRKDRHKNSLEKYMNCPYFWWIVGRFIGDGWIRKNNGIIICTAHNELNEVSDILDKLNIHYCIIKERTIYKIQICSKEYTLFFSQFGKGALNKHLTKIIFDLPQDLLKYFIDGYISADGCNIKGIKKITTISKELAYGIEYCIMKAYHKPVSLYKAERGDKCLIEGRVVNQHNSYELRFNDYETSSNKAFYEGGYIWLPFRSIEKAGKDNVYDIEVEDNHSFTAQNIIVHNCTDFSAAGLQKGMYNEDGTLTRSGLLLHVGRLLDAYKEENKLPKYLMMENVKALTQKKFMPDFQRWLDYLNDLGYNNYWKVLNAKDYGVPQNRERVFVISIRKDIDDKSYVFPDKIPLTIKLKDVLEPVVEDKFYIDDKYLKNLDLSKYMKKDDELNVVGHTTYGDETNSINDTNTIAPVNTTTIHEQPTQITVEDNKDYICCASRGRNSETTDNRYEQQLELNSQGTTNTLTSVQKDNLIVEVNSIEGITNKDETQPILIGGMQKHQAVKTDGISTCLTAAMGTGGGYVPMIIEEVKVKQIGNIVTTGNWDNNQRGRIYDIEGLSPTLNTMQGGGLEPKIIVNEPFNDQEGIARTIKANYYKQSSANLTRDTGSFAATGVVTSVEERMYKQVAETVINNDIKDGDTINPYNKQVNESGVCPTLTTRPEGFKTAILPVIEDNTNIKTTLRIRKLTPLECWRLMGCKDEDFYKAKNSGISNSQLYKQAGNAIVVDVMKYMFLNLFKNKQEINNKLIKNDINIINL